MPYIKKIVTWVCFSNNPYSFTFFSQNYSLAKTRSGERERERERQREGERKYIPSSCMCLICVFRRSSTPDEWEKGCTFCLRNNLLDICNKVL